MQTYCRFDRSLQYHSIDYLRQMDHISPNRKYVRDF